MDWIWIWKILFWTFLQLYSVSELPVATFNLCNLFSGVSHIRRYYASCLFKSWALTMTSDTVCSLVCIMSSKLRKGVTFIDPVPFFDSWLLYVQYSNTYYLVTFSTVHHHLYVWPSDWWVACAKGRNEIGWRPGQEASLAPPCLNLRSFGSKWRKSLRHC